MYTQEHDDMVWNTLLEIVDSEAPDVQKDFIRKIYEIQKEHQFSQDNNESLRQMEKLIDEQIGVMK